MIEYQRRGRGIQGYETTYNELTSMKCNKWKKDIEIFRDWEDKIWEDPMITSLRMNRSIWFFHLRYLPAIEIYHRNIFHQKKKKKTSIETKGPMIDHQKRGREIQGYEITYNELTLMQCNTWKKISKYTEMVKIRYKNDHFVKNEWVDMILSV